MAAGRRTMLAVGLFSAAEKNVFEHAERTYSIYYQYPSTKLDDVMIEMPEGWHVTSLPPETNQDFKLVAYISKVENDKGRLHLSRKLSTNIVLLDTKYYSSLQNFYRMVRTNDEEQIVLLPSAANASK
jgi:PHD/YefM family antitoxin component YafN of YafNO toxin-antitoxin module